MVNSAHSGCGAGPLRWVIPRRIGGSPKFEATGTAASSFLLLYRLRWRHRATAWSFEFGRGE